MFSVHTIVFVSFSIFSPSFVCYLYGIIHLGRVRPGNAAHKEPASMYCMQSFSWLFHSMLQWQKVVSTKNGNRKLVAYELQLRLEILESRRFLLTSFRVASPSRGHHFENFHKFNNILRILLNVSEDFQGSCRDASTRAHSESFVF